MLNSVVSFFKTCCWTFGQRNAQNKALEEYYRIEYGKEDKRTYAVGRVGVQDRLGNHWYQKRIK